LEGKTTRKNIITARLQLMTSRILNAISEILESDTLPASAFLSRVALELTHQIHFELDSWGKKIMAGCNASNNSLTKAVLHRADIFKLPSSIALVRELLLALHPAIIFSCNRAKWQEIKLIPFT
jgi:hypothetical protein